MASVMQLVYDPDWKSVAFSRVFRWQSKFHEEFSFRLCSSKYNPLIYFLVFWTNAERFEREMQCHLKSYHVATSLVPGLLVHKHVTDVVQMDCVRSCSSKTAEENKEYFIKLDVLLNRQNIQWFASTPVTDFRAGRARFGIFAEFFQKISFRQEWCWNSFFLKTGFKIGVHIIHVCALYTGKYGNLAHTFLNKYKIYQLATILRNLWKHSS